MLRRIEDLEIELRECEDKLALDVVLARFRVLCYVFENAPVVEDEVEAPVTLGARLEALQI